MGGGGGDQSLNLSGETYTNNEYGHSLNDFVQIKILLLFSLNPNITIFSLSNAFDQKMAIQST